MKEDNVACRTPAEGRDGVTAIPKWKYDAVRGAILGAVDAAGPTGLPFAQLPNAVRDRLRAETVERIGSLGWHVTTVKLEMEVAGEIARMRGVVPQQIVAARAMAAE